MGHTVLESPERKVINSHFFPLIDLQNYLSFNIPLLKSQPLSIDFSIQVEETNIWKICQQISRNEGGWALAELDKSERIEF